MRLAVAMTNCRIRGVSGANYTSKATAGDFCNPAFSAINRMEGLKICCAQVGARQVDLFLAEFLVNA
jgi:hypothetical protein